MILSQPEVTLTLTEEQHASLYLTLFPGDGQEAVAFLLCGRRAGEQKHRLVVREIHTLPETAYIERSSVKVTWTTEEITPIFDRAEKEDLTVIKVHSHPTGFPDFSDTDDKSDNKLLPCIQGWIETDIPHASVIMLPNGSMQGRILWRDKLFQPISYINVVGSDLSFWFHDKQKRPLHESAVSHTQAFGAGTTELLNRLSIAVIGCSGTGSIIIEQLARLGAKHLVLVDPETIEKRNVNRIINSNLTDEKRYKVDILADAIRCMGIGTTVQTFHTDLSNEMALKSVAECDLVFGGVDSHRGRFIINRLAAYYTLPYFDVGVRLDAAKEEVASGKIRQITGCISYIRPGLSSLISREKISMAQVKAEGLQQNDPAAFEQQLKDGYIHGVQESRPAVISVNMYAASLCVNDFLARLHPYREMPNTDIAEIEFCLSGLEFFTASEKEMIVDKKLAQIVGMGDVVPLLGMPGLIK